MSTTSSSEPSGQQGVKGTHLSANLLSNNPFRNRAASPSNPAASLSSSPFDDPAPHRPLSRNPFLDQPPAVRSPGVASTHSDSQSLSAEDIFNSLTLDDSKPVDFQPSSLPNARRPMERRAPPPRPGEKPGIQPLLNMQKHRPTKSQEEALKAKGQAPSSQPGSSRSPQRKPQRRPRRNSESSIMDFNVKSITEEERKMIEEKRRGKDKLRREGRDGKDKGRSGRPSRRIDIIDQLDATSIYGTGLFHHDGPFDALNPHRNRQSSRRAPMQAFPKDSLNNSIGGSGPLNSQADHSTFMGQTAEAFRDYAAGARAKNAAIFNPVSRGDVIHGDESHGLGTSTFLEGTPAARAAIARHQAEEAQEAMTALVNTMLVGNILLTPYIPALPTAVKPTTATSLNLGKAKTTYRSNVATARFRQLAHLLSQGVAPARLSRGEPQQTLPAQPRRSPQNKAAFLEE
ncbi:hypothetical protein V2A60_010203 [Cordyceps javanica]|uniref:Pal1 cell morphology protein n=1 Tax=Cordyceps javanica TaxID=43265 RepID=A0A545UV89_9HYPO|nr:Pal1 cell morphology protein [Cordyceps javanica]TQW05273.1 Pal1 cell morphology protein [Cordyceps javanica]